MCLLGGCMLRLLLFLIYRYVVFDELSTNVKYIADDTSFFSPCTDPSEIATEVVANSSSVEYVFVKTY